MDISRCLKYNASTGRFGFVSLCTNKGLKEAREVTSSAGGKYRIADNRKKFIVKISVTGYKAN